MTEPHDPSTIELHRLHFQLLMLVTYDAPVPTIRACADQYNAALDQWCEARTTV